jgi:hypothetical protein
MKRRKSLLIILLFIYCFALIDANYDKINNNNNENEDKSDNQLNENKFKNKENHKIVINGDKSDLDFNDNEIIAESDEELKDSKTLPKEEDNEVIESEESVDDIVDEELNVELSENEKQAISLYESALLLLNNSRPDRKKAYNLLIESAKLDHQKSQEMVAKSYLFGDYLPIDLQMAKQYFTSLSHKGNSNAQMV